MTTVHEQLSNAKQLLATLTQVIISIETELKTERAVGMIDRQPDAPIVEDVTEEDDACDALEEQWNALVDDYEKAEVDGLEAMNAVHDKWLQFSAMVSNCEADEEYGEDLQALLGDIVAYQKANQPVKESKPSVSLKPKEVKQVKDETPQKFLLRTLKDVFHYNPNAASSTVRVPNGKVDKIKSQVNELVTLSFPQYRYEYIQSGNIVIININDAVPTFIDPDTTLDEAVRRVRSAYNLIELGVCDDTSEEYDCARDIAEMLIDIAQERDDSSVDLTQPLDEYISFDDEEE